jgi:hypothetical protein
MGFDLSIFFAPNPTGLNGHMELVGQDPPTP